MLAKFSKCASHDRVKAFDSTNLVRLLRSAPVQLGVKVAVLVQIEHNQQREKHHKNKSEIIANILNPNK